MTDEDHLRVSELLADDQDRQAEAEAYIEEGLSAIRQEDDETFAESARLLHEANAPMPCHAEDEAAAREMEDAWSPATCTRGIRADGPSLTPTAGTGPGARGPLCHGYPMLSEAGAQPDAKRRKGDNDASAAAEGAPDPPLQETTAKRPGRRPAQLDTPAERLLAQFLQGSQEAGALEAQMLADAHAAVARLEPGRLLAQRAQEFINRRAIVNSVDPTREPRSPAEPRPPPPHTSPGRCGDPPQPHPPRTDAHRQWYDAFAAAIRAGWGSPIPGLRHDFRDLSEVMRLIGEPPALFPLNDLAKGFFVAEHPEGQISVAPDSSCRYSHQVPTGELPPILCLFCHPLRHSPSGPFPAQGKTTLERRPCAAPAMARAGWFLYAVDAWRAHDSGVRFHPAGPAWETRHDIPDICILRREYLGHYADGIPLQVTEPWANH